MSDEQIVTKKCNVKKSGKRTLKLILSIINSDNSILYLNWVIYSVCVASFNVIWVIIPEKIAIGVAMGDYRVLLFAGIIGGIAAVLCFFTSFLKNKAWMQLNRIRYSVLLKLLEVSLRMPFFKTLDECYLSSVEKARQATMNPNIGIGKIISNVYGLIGFVFSGVGLFGIISRISPFMGFFVLFSVLISFFLKQRINDIEKDIWDKNAEYERKHERVYDLLMEESSGKDVRIFPFDTLLNNYGEYFSNIISKNAAEGAKRKFVFQLLLLLNEFFRNTVVYCWIAIYIIKNELSICSFLTYALSVLNLGIMIQSVLSQCMEVAKETRRFSPYWEIMDCMEAYADSQTETKGVSLSGCRIEFKDVTFCYPQAKEPAVKDLNFILDAGKTTAIVGLNGAGKSTIIKLLCRLYVPQKGKILLEGIDIQKIPHEVYYKLISAVLQESVVLPYSVRDNIVLDKEYNEDTYKRITEQSEMDIVIEKLPLNNETYMSHTMSAEGVELSGGEKQKMLLSRALYREGRIFLLDEPSAAMDPITEENLYQNYRKITKGSTALVISHQLSFVSLCDYIILLENGMVTEQGTHRELLELRGKYNEMYKEQKRLYEE